MFRHSLRILFANCLIISYVVIVTWRNDVNELLGIKACQETEFQSKSWEWSKKGWKARIRIGKKQLFEEHKNFTSNQGKKSLTFLLSLTGMYLVPQNLNTTMIWSEPLKIIIRKTDNDNIAILIIILKTIMMMTTIKLKRHTVHESKRYMVENVFYFGWDPLI